MKSYFFILFHPHSDVGFGGRGHEVSGRRLLALPVECFLHTIYVHLNVDRPPNRWHHDLCCFCCCDGRRWNLELPQRQFSTAVSESQDESTHSLGCFLLVWRLLRLSPKANDAEARNPICLQMYCEACGVENQVVKIPSSRQKNDTLMDPRVQANPPDSS